MTARADRMPPVNVEAETGLVGAVLLDETALDRLPAGFQAAHLFRDSLRLIFDAAVAVRSRGVAVDQFTVDDELRRDARAHARVGGLGGIMDVAQSVAHAGNAAYHAEIVRSYGVRREAIRLALDLVDACYAADEVAEAPVERAVGELLALADSGASDSIADMATVEANYRALMARRRQGEVEGLTTGFPALDAKIGGLAAPRMVILAARPGAGKTGLGLNIASHVARSNARVLFVSQEMGQLELYERLVSHEGHIDNTDLRDIGYLPERKADQVWLRMDEAIGRLRPLSLWIDDTPGRTAGQIESAARRMHGRAGLDLLIVDYIQLLEAEHGARESRQEQMAKISRRMKRLGMTLRIPVLVLAQLNRKVEDREDRVPRKSDLRETGALEQDADQVVLIHRPEEYDAADRPGEADLIVAKNRFGPTGTLTVNFHGPTTSFAPLANQEEDY